MERPEISGQQIPLFDSKRYIAHHFLLPNVIEFPRHIVENNLHDDFIDDLEAEAVSARIFDFPRRIPPPEDNAA